jgi:RNA polymerase sigma-70 factor (ECF subfamily)
MDRSEPDNPDITRILRNWSGGDRAAFDALMPLVYEELHRQASRFLRRENHDHTLQTTALIHEAYIKLIDQRNTDWQNRSHFFAIASQAMRRILVDHARTKHRDKRGGHDRKLPLDEAMAVIDDERSVDLIALDEALTRLEAIDPQQSQVVELRYFSGMSLEDTADVLKISRSTAARDWAMAKAWLHRELTR